ncbi:dienelactone hydrolase family protein [Streptomyces fagopyri]
MSQHVVWSDGCQVSDHSTRRSFMINRPFSAVPGTVWTPRSPSGAVPLVLLGHGGSGHRHSDRIRSLADRITSSGCAAAAIDGPFHGERVTSPLTPAEYQRRTVAEGIGNVLDRMAGDWVATRDLLVDAGMADRTRQAYFGFSMGTRFGLAAALALGPGLKCAVFGKFGTQSATALDPGLHAPDRALNDASAIVAPVLFHLQWDDEIFPRPGQIHLFDAFASTDKELHGFTGGHRHTPEHAPAIWLAFIDRHLVRAARPGGETAGAEAPGRMSRSCPH